MKTGYMSFSIFMFLSVFLWSSPNTIVVEKNQSEGLWKAVFLNDIHELQILLKSGVDVNLKRAGERFHGETPLHLACERNYICVAQLLLTAGANVNARDEYGDIPLHKVAQRGLLNFVDMLVQFGSDVNIQNHEQLTALHYSCFFIDRSLVKKLLSVGANPNLIDSDGYNCLLHLILGYLDRDNGLSSSVKGDVIAICHLLNLFGLDVNARQQEGNTVLHFVANLNPLIRDFFLIHLFMQLGADVNLKNEQGRVPLHCFIQSDLFEHEPYIYIDESRWKCLDSFVHFGANVNAQDNHGDTPLHLFLSPHAFLKSLVLKSKYIYKTVQLFIDSGYQIDLKNKDGDTALHLAYQIKKMSKTEEEQVYASKIIEMLMTTGANDDIKNASGLKPSDFLELS